MTQFHILHTNRCIGGCEKFIQIRHTRNDFFILIQWNALTLLVWRIQNRQELWLAEIVFAVVWHLCVGTSNWPNLYWPIQCTFGKRSTPFRAYHQLMHPAIYRFNSESFGLQSETRKWYGVITFRCCWHSVHSGSYSSCASGIASCTTNVDCTARQRVQLIKLFLCKNWRASSKPC